jgi:hypothetical protein
MLKRRIFAFLDAKSLRTISKPMLSMISSEAQDNCFGIVKSVTSIMMIGEGIYMKL